MSAAVGHLLDENHGVGGPSIHLGLVLPAGRVAGPFMVLDTPLGSPEARAQSGRLGEDL
jgi:hypothetical protein